MAKYLIEVSHENKKAECARVVEFFLKTGSHFLTQADWGCMDGEHKAWIIANAESKEEARRIVPPNYRSQARVVCLNKFTMADIEEELEHHED